MVTAAALLGASQASAQTTANVTVMKDATIRGGAYASTIHGAEPILVTRASNDPSYIRRAALTFDTEATIPDNATIQSATLVLNVLWGNGETRQLGAYGLPVSFEEPDATWLKRNASTSWTNAGGDTTGSYSTGTVTVTGSQVSFNVTQHVQAVIRGQYGSRFSRFLVIDLGSSSANSYKEFHSRESADSSRRPRLIVTYGGTSTAPPPSSATAVPDSAGDIAMGPEHVAARAGKWVVESKSGAINGQVIRHPDAGLAKIDTALAGPPNYVEMKFQAQAGKPYRLWIHGRADGDHWANDSVHAQFSGSVTSTGSATYRIGTSSATWVNLEECSGCGLTDWKWQDNGYGSGVLGPTLYFDTTGTHTIRIQTREDGLSIDRVLLSPVTYMSAPPGGNVPAPAPAPAPEPVPAPAPSPDPTGATTIKVLHWNIHHGVGQDGVYDIPRFVNWMVKWNPDIISINEAEKYTGYGNEDQPERFKTLMQQATGRTWYYAFAQEYGSWNANGKGNLILSRFPITSIGRHVLSYTRTILMAGVVVNGRTLTIMSTHLDPYTQSYRYTQAQEVVNLASSWPEARIIAGDFNAWPDQTSIGVMTTPYYDSFAEAEKMGTATALSDISPFGATRKGRIDYIFHSKGSTTVLRLKSVQVPDTRDSNGNMPSDHRPVVATYEVR
jgi:endonuclease/exonuclease/phosphatase family metal-dependent hydrolase